MAGGAHTQTANTRGKLTAVWRGVQCQAGYFKPLGLAEAASSVSAAALSLFAAAIQCSVDEAPRSLALEVLARAHQGRVVDERVQQLPVTTRAPCARYLILLLLLLHQLNSCD